jgi:uncharacterized protein YgbK (DUF1537 family)
LLLTYYGDDFTGSTDVLEALYSGGIEAVLFVTPPSSETLRRYDHVRAFGIAGTGRTMSPDEMEETLPGIFRLLQSHKPPMVHYKVCSTFDSSPNMGSIGRAIDIGHGVFQNQLIPLAVGAPALGRYCVFGNLFAKSGLNSAPFRLDRHPTMRHHPVTPMTEADLRVHLSRQTSRPIELVDVLTLDSGCDAVRAKVNVIESPGSVVLFDTLTGDHLESVGRAIWEMQQPNERPQFVVGSSGVDYALVKYWQAAGIVPRSERGLTRLPARAIDAVDRTLILSGSCSPVTDRQIGWALENNFADVAIDMVKLSDAKTADAEICAVVRQINSSLDSGQSVVTHTARGPNDPRIQATKCPNSRNLGFKLGQILRDVLRARSVRRVAMVGGDTAGGAARALDIEAVEMVGPLEPGAPLCVVRSPDPAIDGAEITFKGGQVGYDDFFGTLLSGRRNQSLVGATP